MAAFAGFHGTTTPLHRAAAAGHLSTCIAIVELIKLKIAAAEEAVADGKQRPSTVKRWKSLLKTVLDQQTHRGQTPLLLACEAGHADVTAYLLSEGADPLASDMFHCRTALHFAAMGGHAACVRVLCAESTIVNVDGNPRPLRDVVSTDLQVQTAKYIDQRSVGGLTALHFGAVSGNLETLQVLLQAGASIMVKTDGEAFIGQEYLTPGSTPLHIAVLVGSMPLAHALLQAHANLMTIAGGGRDERRRRPWEGHSRSDIRSVRNQGRKLPYHLARDRGWTQMMHLVDPRVAVDAALDAARDTDHGIGPKNLATICSIVLQQSLLKWLDQRETEMEVEREEEQQAAARDAAAVAGVTFGRPPQPPDAVAAIKKTPSKAKMSPSKVETIPAAREIPISPFAPMAAQIDLMAENSLERDALNQSPPPTRSLYTTASAPVTPRELSFTDSSTRPAAPAAPMSVPAVPTVQLESMGSLHAYVGMLSVRRPAPSGTRHKRRASLGWGDLASSNGTTNTSSSIEQQAKKGMPRASSTGALTRGLGLPPQVSETSFTLSITSGTDQGAAAGPMRRVLSTLRDRLRSSEAEPVATPDDGSDAACPGSGESCDDCKSVVCGSCSDDGSGNSAKELECGVCLDHVVEVAFSGCEHALCLECARNLTKQEKKPPSCPFCRRMVVGFLKV